MSNTENTAAPEGRAATIEKRAAILKKAGEFLNKTFPKRDAEFIPDEFTVVMDGTEWDRFSLAKVEDYCKANRTGYFICAVEGKPRLKVRLVIFSLD